MRTTHSKSSSSKQFVPLSPPKYTYQMTCLHYWLESRAILGLAGEARPRALVWQAPCGSSQTWFLGPQRIARPNRLVSLGPQVCLRCEQRREMHSFLPLSLLACTLIWGVSRQIQCPLLLHFLPHLLLHVALPGPHQFPWPVLLPLSVHIQAFQPS